MSKVFVTGSSTGLGLMAARSLAEIGHQVVVHGRNRARSDAALAAVLMRSIRPRPSGE
jgi:NAD(P)-dependent dehydrogenase (short-subunit alcohol dehydrogenase family)